MPLQNRITPWGSLISTPARGTLMGNRGCLHDDLRTIRRPFRGRRWIVCLLQFKDRRRSPMTPGQYTELFFLDEATALAAGHRPCAECQRARFNLFRRIWSEANPALAGGRPPAAADLDAVLHEERITDCGQKVTYQAVLGMLPAGVIVSLDTGEDAYLWLAGRLLRWHPAGYGEATAPPAAAPVHVLTPRSVVATLAAGYPVEVHPSVPSVLSANLLSVIPLLPHRSC